MDRRSFLRSAWLTACATRLHAQIASCPLHLRFGVAQFDQYDPLADIDALAAAGFDYIEPAVVKVMQRDDRQFERIRQQIKNAAIHVETMNSFLPAEMKVVGPDVNQLRLREYIQRSLARAEALGARVIVFGSGDARMNPAGFSKERAWGQLREFLAMVGEEIERNGYGMKIGIEAMRKAECNLINLTADAYKLAVQTNHPKVRIICDFFHLATEREDPKVLYEVKDYLVHLHFSDPAGGRRRFPMPGKEIDGAAAFFSCLRAINYDGRLSLEANTENFKNDSTSGLAAVRSLYRSACSARS